MSGKEGTSNESDRNPVQRFTAEQIQQLAKAIFSLNNNGKNDTFVSAAGLLARNSFINYAFTKSWILDSGATNHFASDSQFSTHTSSSFIPNCNLERESLPTLNCCVVFTPHGCVLHDLATGRMIGSGKQHAGLYYMFPLPNQAQASQISTDLDLWHKRLGHPSLACLQLASSLLPINKNLILIHNNCSICPKAKQTRLPFPLSTIKSHSPFNILHCDIWGPHKTLTHFGKCFFLIIVDDYTRCTWLFLMNHKSETQHLLESFIIFAQNQFQASIKTISVDNRLEFISMRNFFLKKGIECQRICVYTPQQNGVVERKHRHILNTTRALLFQSHLPLEFWGNAF